MAQEIMHDGRLYRVSTEVHVLVDRDGRRKFWRRIRPDTPTYDFITRVALGLPAIHVYTGARR
jgi:hypothetical protein